MPMLSGTHLCSKCGLEMFWEYHYPKPFPNCITYKYTHGSHRVKLQNSLKSKQLEFQIECTNCEQVDFLATIMAILTINRNRFENIFS